MKRFLMLVFFIFVSAAYALPNPASVYCEQHGGKSKLEKEGDGAWVGLCLFSDYSYCEEWSYLRGNCKPGDYFLPEKRRGSTYCIFNVSGKNSIIYLCRAK